MISIRVFDIITDEREKDLTDTESNIIKYQNMQE